ncbi:MAG TPA: hypothetical protein PLC53_02985 [Bacilli bacterium]|nr:hypothetical protein [Bacilli bacterium]
MKRKRLFFLVIFIVLILLIAGSVVGYILKKNRSDSYTVFSYAINNIYTKIADQYISDATGIEGSLIYTSDSISYPSSDNIIDLLMGINLDLNFKIDYQDKVALMNINSSFGETAKLNIKKYYESNKIYTYIADETDNYVWQLKDDTEYNNIYERLELKKEYLDVLDGLRLAILDYSNMKYYLQSSGIEKKEINGKKYNTFLNMIVINENNYLEILKNVNELLKDNDKFLESYNASFGVEYDISNYDELVEYLKDNEIYIMLYTSIFTGDFLALDIVAVNETDASTFSIYKDSDKYKFEVFASNIDISGELDIGDKQGTIVGNINSYSDNPEFNISYSFNYIDGFEKEDVTNSTSIYDITSDEYAEIYRTFFSRKEWSNINDIYNIYMEWKNPEYYSRTITFIW